MAKVKQGEDFAVLAAQYSEDADEKKNGGYKNLTDIPASSELRLVFGKRPPDIGEVLGPIENKKQLYLLRLEKINLPLPLPLAQVKDTVKHDLQIEKMSQ